MVCAQVGRVLLDLGVISAEDMTTEAIVTKMAYLIGRGLNDRALRQAMGEDLRGELSPMGKELVSSNAAPSFSAFLGSTSRSRASSRSSRSTRL